MSWRKLKAQFPIRAALGESDGYDCVQNTARSELLVIEPAAGARSIEEARGQPNIAPSEVDRFFRAIEDFDWDFVELIRLPDVAPF